MIYIFKNICIKTIFANQWNNQMLIWEGGEDKFPLSSMIRVGYESQKLKWDIKDKGYV